MTTQEDAFSRLREGLEAYEPLSLLSQMTLTFQFFPAGDFPGEDSDIVRWSRRIEFMTGLLITRSYPGVPLPPADGAALEKVEKLFDDYERAATWDLTTKRTLNAPSPEVDLLLREVKTYAMTVRGDAYPHQLYEYAQGLYSPHDLWFKEHLGFTIREAISIAKAIPPEYERRKKESKTSALARAKASADELISTGEATEEQRGDIESSYGCYFHYGDSTNLLGFTAEQLAEFSNTALPTCIKFLQRMSQAFGYRNPNFGDTFTEASRAPWDYNTLNERPLIQHEGRYWLLVPALLKSVLMNTFFYDLMADAKFRPAFEKERGRFIEAETARYLKRIFPADSVFLNPAYPNSEEFADVLVLHDRKILIFQCKAKGLTHAANIGADFDTLKNDLTKGVQSAFAQGVRSREYLNSDSLPELLLDGREVVIDMEGVNTIQIVSVTLAPFQNLTTRFANAPCLNLFTDNDHPWSVSLGSLDILTQFLPSPAQFLHYMHRRLGIERTPFAVFADEMDLLAYYLLRGLYFPDPKLENINSLGIAGLSGDIDQYVFERFEMNSDPVMPRPPMPPGFEEILDQVERMGADYSTDSALALLDLSSDGRKQFMQMVRLCTQETVKDHRMHSASMVQQDGKRGISFLTLDTAGNPDLLHEGVVSFAEMRKYSAQCDTWIGFGWSLGSERVVDSVYFTSHAWHVDERMEQLAKDHLKPGTQVQPESSK